MMKSNFEKSYGLITVTSKPLLIEKRHQNNITFFPIRPHPQSKFLATPVIKHNIGTWPFHCLPNYRNQKKANGFFRSS